MCERESVGKKDADEVDESEGPTFSPWKADEGFDFI